MARNFQGVAEALDQKVSEICALVWATEEPICFLSMDARTKKRDAKRIKKKIKRLEKEIICYPQYDDDLEEVDAHNYAVGIKIAELKEQQVYKPNFREATAKKKEYKGSRKGSVKPLHYDNLTEYILATYECVMAEGLEADDLLSVYQCKALAENPDPTTIICSRDKDLAQCEGMYFSWECGRQKQFGPVRVVGMGELRSIYRGVKANGDKKIAEVKGTGTSFFGAQILMGDPTDSIPGLPGVGPAKAYEALKGCKDEEVMFTTIKDLYISKFGEEWDTEMLEQGRLLYMTKHLYDDGTPVLWELPGYLLEDV